MSSTRIIKWDYRQFEVDELTSIKADFISAATEVRAECLYLEQHNLDMQQTTHFKLRLLLSLAQTLDEAGEGEWLMRYGVRITRK